MVFTSGVTVGLATVEVNRAGTELQTYVLPVTGAAPIVVLVLGQIALSAPAAAAGNGLTVTLTLLVLVHPVAVTVSTTV